MVQAPADERQRANEQQRVPDVVRVVAAPRHLVLRDEQQDREAEDVADAVPADADRPDLDQDRVGRELNQRQDVARREHARSIPILARMTEQYIGWALVLGLVVGGALVWYRRRTDAAQWRGDERRGADALKPPGSATRSPRAAAWRPQSSSTEVLDLHRRYLEREDPENRLETPTTSRRAR